MDGLKLAIEHLGGASKLARGLGVTPQHVCNWKSRRVPLQRCVDIEKLTDGAVRCEELRPDVEWSVLRHSLAREAA